ncbi:Hypothetical predicted protein [Paramuricea clavata]|uniref:Uncharacterized protein n=1 Tax=Paramuricea clavata TaxID=317549 RepID=A0A6S7JWS8_PARCT|nr:Hypothetical predicted protein [Paramuricea clavata]
MYLDMLKQSGSILLHIAEFKESMNIFIFMVVESYRYYLGLPEKDSDEFGMMTPQFQEHMRSFFWTTNMEIDFNIWIESFNTGPRRSQGSLITRWLDEAYAKVFDPLRSTCRGLICLLDAMEKLALAILEDKMSSERNRRT